MIDPFADEKRRLRKELRVLRARAASSAERMVALQQHALLLVEARELPPGAIVGLFAPSRDEAGVAGIAGDLRLRGIQVAFPRVDESDELKLFVLHVDEELAPGFRGIDEPPNTSAVCEVSNLAMLFVPGLGFDSAGQRLGQGGGHYDRLLATLPASVLKVGVAFDAQVIDVVPSAPHDIPVDILLTESGIVGGATITLSDPASG